MIFAQRAPYWIGIAWLALILGLPTKGWSIEPVPVEFLWQSEPKLDFDWWRYPQPFHLLVPKEQLEAVPARDRMQAAQSILLVPQGPKLDRAGLLAALINRLEKGEPHSDVRLEIFAAACELDDGANASRLWKLAQTDENAKRLVQSVCIRWRKGEPLDYWRKRLNVSDSSEQDLLYAIDGLGAAGLEEDVQPLTTLVLDATQSAAVRLCSARAIGNISRSDQLSLAQKLKDCSAAHAHLLAVEVLANSPVESTTQFVQEIALHGQLLAQRSAYRWLCQRDPSSAQRLIGNFLKHSDAEVRLLTLEQVTLIDNDQTVSNLFDAFGDVNPRVRSAARVHVLTCCTRSAERLKSVCDRLPSDLAATDWRSLEQIIRLTVELNQPEHCSRLVDLVEHPRAEVCVTASWALRHLAKDTAILQRMLDYVERMTDKLLANDQIVTEMHLQCMAHLMEAFGHRKFDPAKKLVLKYVPKDFHLGMITRMTAIWSCGKLWEHSENKSLIKELHARIADKDTPFPEAVSVRFAATLALGWIADPESREPLVINDEGIPTSVGYATQWALKRIDER